MKTFKLWIHQKNFSEDELVINPKDFNDKVKIDDIVEIYHPEEEYSRLLLQVKSLREDLSQGQKDIVSVAKAVAETFHFQVYKDVIVNVVDPKNVALDLAELKFKEQYFSRADMWRLKKSMINTSVYLTKKVRFAEMSTYPEPENVADVEELWSKGDKVTCGVVTEDTRVAFRSSTAQVNIFIQLSSEMWEFDNYGDLYFEKAVGGFLEDLFSKWKEHHCTHDVTITLFSRTFYDAKNMDDIPIHMRECVQQDYLGRIYEDFYRVVVQNERYDDWTSTIIELKKLFIEYPKRVLNYHQRKGVKVPRAWNSTAAQGNFLEVLNMGLNVFEKYYLDRCFDRTGKLSIVITPGVGVFEVDRELTNCTKQRTIDCGSGTDLLCMGEQPLHAVPLFKFHNKNAPHGPDVGDDYNIPHWINHSFYTSKSQAEKIAAGKFIPRIKMPSNRPSVLEEHEGIVHGSPIKSSHDVTIQRAVPHHKDADNFPFVDYDEYDAQVFKIPTFKSMARNVTKTSRNAPHQTSSYGNLFEEGRHAISQPAIKSNRLVLSATEVASYGHTDGFSTPAINIPQAGSSCSLQSQANSYNGNEQSCPFSDDINPGRQVIGSAGSPVGHQSKHSINKLQPPRALINPFAPSRLHFKVTSNRRRWAHAFPTDLRGASVQPHHQSRVSSKTEHLTSTPTKEVVQAAQHAIELRRQRSHKVSEGSDADLRSRMLLGSSIESEGSDLRGESVLLMTYNSGGISTGGIMRLGSSGALNNTMVESGPGVLSTLPVTEGSGTSGRSKGYSRSSSQHKDLGQYGFDHDEGHTWLWGITGEQEWTPEIFTGMDWKSMTRPASLPITTDYFPDQKGLQMDYVISGDYTLLPEQFQVSSPRKPLTTSEVYYEMVAQRIAQGFQLIIPPKHISAIEASNLNSSPYQGTSTPLIRLQSKPGKPVVEHRLSIGRIFHKLTLKGESITVMMYRPRHPFPTKQIHYTYRFQVPDSLNYDVSWTNFYSEKLENYNWNYLDQYICTRGEDDFGLTDSLKYWRARFFLLPSNNPVTKKILDGAERCDIYEPRTLQEQKQLTEGFIKFVEILNKIRRPGQSRKPKMLARRASQTAAPGVSLLVQLAEKDKLDPTAGKAKSIPKFPDAAESLPSGTLSSPVVGSEQKKFMINTSSSDTSTVHSSHSSPQQGFQKGPESSALDGSDLNGLTVNSPLSEIKEAMLDQTSGLSFLSKQPGLPELPPNTFIAYEATAWLQSNIDGLQSEKETVEMLQRMVDEKLIVHASRGSKHKFINGFYLYSILPEKNRENSMSPEACYGSTYFQFEWCEVAVHSNKDSKENVPSFLAEELSNHSSAEKNTLNPAAFASSPDWRNDHSWGGRTNQVQFTEMPQNKLVNVDVDPSRKSDREEWGTAMYHGNYNPICGFELEVQWLVATGSVLGELVMNWSRKATTCGFHFLPVPGDPFALPFTSNSDPLRGPIFIPLNIECLSESPEDLFQDFALDTREERFFLFQDSILKRFGFMRDRFIPDTIGPLVYGDDGKNGYTHCTGGMFVLVPDIKTTSPRNQDGTHHALDPAIYGSYKDYVAWQRSVKKHHHDSRVGFLWAWNYMLSKRCRSSNTGDEMFQDKMLADFRAFCSNTDNRLVEFWQSSCEKVKKEHVVTANETIS